MQSDAGKEAQIPSMNIACSCIVVEGVNISKMII